MQLRLVIDIMTEGCRRLWAAVLEQAVEDVKRGRDNSDTALSWFQSDSENVGSFLWVCGILGIDPESIKRILVQRHSGIPVRRVEGYRSVWTQRETT